jgi:hypothetical protein
MEEMCFYCGAKATNRILRNLSTTYSNEPDDLLELLDWHQSGRHKPDRTPIQLAVSVCETHSDAAVDCLLDIFGSVEQKKLTNDYAIKPCPNLFHTGGSGGVPIGPQEGRWAARGCPDCDSFTSTTATAKTNPVYIAVRNAVAVMAMAPE